VANVSNHFFNTQVMTDPNRGQEVPVTHPIPEIQPAKPENPVIAPPPETTPDRDPAPEKAPPELPRS
jgi:hypothetical protein